MFAFSINLIHREVNQKIRLQFVGQAYALPPSMREIGGSVAPNQDTPPSYLRRQHCFIVRLPLAKWIIDHME